MLEKEQKKSQTEKNNGTRPLKRIDEPVIDKRTSKANVSPVIIQDEEPPFTDEMKAEWLDIVEQKEI